MKNTVFSVLNTHRALLVRLLLLCAFVLLVVFSFISGKGHTLIIDNKTASDGSVSAVNGVLVTIGGSEELEMYKEDRLMLKVKGQNHVVTMVTVNGGVKTEKRIVLPLMTETMLLSIPKLLAGMEPNLEVFVPLNVAPKPDESVGNTNSYTSPDAEPSPEVLLLQ